jgi:hypothetical protein
VGQVRALRRYTYARLVRFVPICAQIAVSRITG